MYSLTANQLTKQYPRATAVNLVDVALQPGKIYGLLGPNGSGKSTFMKNGCRAGASHGRADPCAGPSCRAGYPRAGRIHAHRAILLWVHDDQASGTGSMLIFYQDFSTEAYTGLIGKMGLEMDMRVSQLSSGIAGQAKSGSRRCAGTRS